MNGPNPGEVLNEAEALGLNLVKSAGLSDRLVSHWPAQRAAAAPVALQAHR
jgi:hypothetical protein